MKTRVVVTGVGFVTPLGHSLSSVWQNILNKKIASKKWNDLEKLGFRSSIASRVEGFKSETGQKGSEMALFAVSKAVRQARLNIRRLKTGLFVGSTLGESQIFEEHAEGNPRNPALFTCASISKSISKTFGINGPIRTYGTACAAGNYAIHGAAQHLKCGFIDAAIAGGVDPFSKIAMAGFSRARAMSVNGECKPFDKQRNGMLLGEGAAFLVLERENDALKRNITPLAVIGEAGFTSDAYHPTAPNPDGKYMKKAMEQALKKQRLVIEEVDWICAHGSGTPVSDTTEAAAINALFGSYKVPVSGFKGGLGHSLGAATAVEAVICTIALNQQVIPPTPNFNDMDENLNINVISSPLKTKINWVLNCGYAFGGINSALLIGKWNKK